MLLLYNVYGYVTSLQILNKKQELVEGTSQKLYKCLTLFFY